MIRRAAADDVDAAHGAQGVLVKRKFAEIDTAVLDARADGVAHGGGLLVDLLHHEMLVAALFGRLGVPFDGGGLLFDLLAVDVVEGDRIRG